MNVIVIMIILTVALLLSLPAWPYSRTWGASYWPSLILTVILLIMEILIATGNMNLRG